jgi:hypothetical protein
MADLNTVLEVMDASLLKSDELAVRRDWQANFPSYAEDCLLIKPKSGGYQPLKLNTAQMMAHEFAEQMLRDVGYVRINLLKARQMGLSTYIVARGLHKTTHREGYKTVILSHLQDTTDELFDMVDTFVHNLPPETLPQMGAANAKELVFERIGSKYSVGTAGNVNFGRGKTTQFFHGSEVAFWKEGAKVATGALQSVADVKHSEVWLETTANGREWFQEQWSKAERGDTLYRNLFIPWYVMDDYTSTPPDGFEPTTEEWAIIEAYGLSFSQIWWRRGKIATLGSKEAFQQEYPATAEEAFEGGRHSGRVFPMEQRLYTVEPFAIPDEWKRGYGLDFGWNPDPTAVVSLAYDQLADCVYAIAEYAATELTPQSHASNLEKMGLRQLPGICDPFGGKHRGPDGSQVLQSYINAGLNLYEADRLGVLSSVLDLRERLETGRYKVFSTCNRLLQEMRMYVFNDKNGQPADRDNHLIDASRYPIVCGLSRFVSTHDLKGRRKVERRNRNPWAV